MLKLNYSLRMSSNIQEIKLDDMYVARDLSFVSGTTEHLNSCSPGNNLWVRSPYFPEDLPAKVTSKILVKRNGYVLVPLTLQVHSSDTITSQDSNGNAVYERISYIEHNGNTYYASVTNGNFLIDGVEYSQLDSFVTIKDKIYVENDKIIVNGIVYNATINNHGDLLLSDSVGEPYLYDSTWDTTNVVTDSTFVEKLTIGENIKNTIDVKRLTYFGHRAYIVYNEEKYYIDYFYDENGKVNGAGVKINGEYYACSALYECKDYNFNETYNIYNINDYYTNETGNSIMQIGDNEYIINFEPCEIEGCGIIGIDTVLEELPILKDDRIIIKSLDNNSEVIVRRDDNNQQYVYLNGRRYNSIKNLCDEVTLGGVNFTLNYNGDVSQATLSTIASCDMYDGSKMYFQVTEVNEGRPSKVMKVELVNGSWKPLYSMEKQSDGAVKYQPSSPIDVHNYDGFLIDGTKMKIYNRTTVYGDEEDENSPTIKNSYDYIIVGSKLEYGLKVINTVGSNKFLCVPDVNPLVYGTNATDQLVAEILCSISGNNCVIEKRNNTFGTTDLYYDTWMNEAWQNGGATSVYELADIWGNISIFKKSSHFTIPITLYKNIGDKCAYDDLITNLYYEEEAEKAINKLVDMDKDMYSPVISNGEDLIEPSSLIFNLHFRTRDLETWKIYEDEGTYNTNLSGSLNQSTNLSANYQYCNYFVTDYYPYYRYAHNSTYSKDNFGKLVDTSDLLGFLYFTTDDVKNKREKLRKSFLRLTFFDSINPEKQNMLGTSTMYFDYERCLNVIYQSHDGYHYEPVAKTRNYDRVGTGVIQTDRIDKNIDNSPTVLNECFVIPDYTITSQNLVTGYDNNLRIDSRIKVTNRYLGDNSSEGFYSYILKEFAKMNNLKGPEEKDVTIYMKAEFFHAGLGIKIPMIIPTKKEVHTQSGDVDYTAIPNSGWTSSVYNNFLKGYDMNDVFNRLYVPIKIKYSKVLKKFIYMVSDENGFDIAINRNNTDLVFNLFELKLKP